MDELTKDAGVRPVIAALMAEVQAVGEKLGVTFGLDIETRIRHAARIGAHKTSMLQDVEAGRLTEIEALVGSVTELGRMLGVATPTLDTILALVRLRDRTSGKGGD